MKNILPCTLSGIITPFEGNGRKLGYPTANIKTVSVLKDGVYFGYATLRKYKNHPALIFIGQPITVGAEEHRVEAHLLDIPDKDYYGLKILLTVHHFHRPNLHFGSINELLAAMKSDEEAIRRWLSTN